MPAWHQSLQNYQSHARLFEQLHSAVYLTNHAAQINHSYQHLLVSKSALQDMEIDSRGQKYGNGSHKNLVATQKVVSLDLSDKFGSDWTQSHAPIGELLKQSAAPNWANAPFDLLAQSLDQFVNLAKFLKLHF